VPFIALGIIVVFALILKFIFSVLFKTKVSWVFVLLAFGGSILLSVLLIIFSFTKIARDNKKFQEEAPIRKKIVSDHFVLESVDFNSDEDSRSFSVEIKYYFDNLPDKPVIEERYVGGSIQAGFDQKNLNDYGYYVGNCQPFSLGGPKRTEYAGAREIKTESEHPLQNGPYKIKINYKVGGGKGGFCDPETMYKSLDGLDFYVKLYNPGIGYEVVKTIPATLKISYPDPNQELTNLNNKVINAIRKEDMEELYNYISPSMKTLLTVDSFINVEKTLADSQGSVVTVELLQTPQKVILDEEQNGEWAQSVLSIRRQKITKEYVVRYLKESDKWWLVGTVEK
jgi:hypothetical protein